MKTDIGLPDLSQIHVLVVGDVMLDQYWFGAVERISPEAPVPIVSVDHGDKRGGGAANVALNVIGLGATCTLLSVTGDDTHAIELEQMLASQGINVIFIKDKQYDTTVKQRVISRNQQLIRLDFERKPGVELLSRCMREFENLVDNTQSVIFSDYGKGSLENITEMIKHAKARDIPVSVDPKGKSFSRYSHASLITPNLKEFELVVGDVINDEQMNEKAKQLVSTIAIDHLLITLSEKGMKLFSNDDSMHYSPARSREVYDVSGAGDTVIACLGTLLASQLDLESILEIANAAAGIVVAKLGTAVANVDEITAALARSRESV